MLSPDPYVQVPEYSQNFNRYSYVMNNPLNLTDPSGFNWLGDIFKSVGSWLKQNWQTVVVIVVMAVIVIASCGTLTGAAAAMGGALLGATATAAVATTAGAWAVAAIGGAFLGGIAGGLSAALAGGDLGDVLRGATIGGISGALSAGLSASGVGGVAEVAGQGVVGGATNVAMGGKFQDGFLSAAASSAGMQIPYANSGTAGLIKSGVVGGTASALGGGKFANGAYTAAFQYLVTNGLNPQNQAKPTGNYTSEQEIALSVSNSSYLDNSGGIILDYAPEYQDSWGFSAAMYGSKESGFVVSLRGTQLLSLADWYSNVLQAFGIPNPQYQMVKSLARTIYDRTGGNVLFVGHSLGGGLASAAAMVTGANAITFNAAGLHPWTASGGRPQIAALYIQGEILSLVQDISPLPNASGQRIGFSPKGVSNPIGLHSIESF